MAAASVIVLLAFGILWWYLTPPRTVLTEVPKRFVGRWARVADERTLDGESIQWVSIRFSPRSITVDRNNSEGTEGSTERYELAKIVLKRTEESGCLYLHCKGSKGALDRDLEICFRDSTQKFYVCEMETNPHTDEDERWPVGYFVQTAGGG